MLHNFLHNPQLGFSLENEMSFSNERASLFFNLFQAGQYSIYEFFSFLGWIGVAVFVFLTGYGLAKSSSPSPSEVPRYIRNHFLKLFLLLLPAMIVFIIGDLAQHNLFPTLFKRLSYLALVANWIYPWVYCPPGVYWYFGLTFQFYLIYAFFGGYFDKKNLLLLSLLTIVGLGILCSLEYPEVLSVYRHCFTGWFVLFAIGIWAGKQRDLHLTTSHSIVVDILLLVFSLGLVILMNKWMLTWLLVPVVALVMFLSIGFLLLRSGILRRVFIWVGGVSASLFAVHPIARFLINRTVLPRVDNLHLVILMYVIASFIMAMCYDKLYKKLFVSLIKQNR
jgi:peptidoglycan/LPS O-acetylase OafA/YrhL